MTMLKLTFRPKERFYRYQSINCTVATIPSTVPCLLMNLFKSMTQTKYRIMGFKSFFDLFYTRAACNYTSLYSCLGCRCSRCRLFFLTGCVKCRQFKRARASGRGRRSFRQSLAQLRYWFALSFCISEIWIIFSSTNLIDELIEPVDRVTHSLLFVNCL